jgi:hypothetical protein
VLYGLYPLYFVTCLVTNPAHCVTRVHYFDPEQVTTPMSCLRVAQPQIAQWQNRNGDRWHVETFRCGKPPRDDGQRI